MAISNSTLYAPRLPLIIPKTEDPALQQHVKKVTDEVNSIPPTSTFSYSTPNSNVTAMPGTWGHNFASGVSVTWFKQVGSGNTGWVPLI